MRQLVITLFSFIIFFAIQGSAQAVEVNLPYTNAGTMKEPIFAEQIILEGESASYEFSYRLIENQPAQQQQLHLFFQHSTLLISPSSLTVAIDGVPVTSIGLETSKSELIVPLEGKALEEGTHIVSILFSGKLKDGVCINQNTSGNWLTLKVSSYMQIDGLVNRQLTNLNQYPAYFTGTKTRQTQIIVPDEPTLPVLNAALQLQTYLLSSSEEDSVQLVKESELKRLTQSTIVIGLQAQFKQQWLTALITDANFTADGLSISLQPMNLSQNEMNYALVVTASDEQHFDKITALTEVKFVKQLDGTNIALTSLAYNPAKKSTDTLTFEQIGIPNLQLEQRAVASDIFYYHMPNYPFPDTKATLHLEMNVSDILLKESPNVEAELIVYINSVPHSVAINEQKKDENGDITLKMPISNTVFTNSLLMTIQVEATGLYEKDICIESDEKRWIYVKQSSALHFQNNHQNVSAYTFRLFPFVDLEEQVAIILPEQYAWSDLQAIYQSLTMNGMLPDIVLYRTVDVTEEQLKKRHVLFLGGKAEHAILANEPLAVYYHKQVPDLAEHGFINVRQFAFIQNNPWDEAFSCIVFDQKDSSTSIVSLDFAQQLKLLRDNATIAVYNYSGNVFTNKDEIKEQNFANKLTSQKIGDVSFYLSIILFLVLVALIIYVAKKRRKKA